MAIIKYTKEFFYIASSIAVLTASACILLIILFAPFALTIYLGDVLGYHDVIAMGAAIIIYYVYYIIARHFNLIKEIK